MDKTLIYVQSTYGIGHLMRMLSLARIMGNTTIAYGGPMPKLRIPPDIDLIQLDCITDETKDIPEMLAARKPEIKGLFLHVMPKNLIIEHFPFGRNRFTQEIHTLLDLARENGTRCISSFRGALTGNEDPDWVRQQLAYFDMLLVHNDEDECDPADVLDLPRHKVFHTGYLPPYDMNEIMPKDKVRRQLGITDKLIVVSAGGGRDGYATLKPAIESLKKENATILIAAGPFMPDKDYQRLKEIDPRFRVTRFNPSFLSYLNAADRSISMAGYNTFSALMYTQTPAQVIPRTSDAEQKTRASQPLTSRRPTHRYMAIPGLLKETPREVKISIIRDCNNRCIMCGHWQDPDRHKKQIDYDTFATLAKDLGEMGIKKIRITGGEPLIHPDLYAIIENAKAQGFFVEVCTNGLLLTEETADRFARLGLDQVSISLDAGESELHDRIRGRKGAFEKAVQAFRYLRAKDPFMKLHCNTVIMNKNYQTIDGIIDLADEIGITHLTLAPLKMYIPQLEKLRLTSEQLRSFHEEIYPALCRRAQTVQINLIPKFLPELPASEQIKAFMDERFGEFVYSRYYCSKPLRRFDIKSDGSVLPCCGLLDDALIMGNINHESIIDIWNSERYQNYRNATHLPRHEQCRYCATYQHQNIRKTFLTHPK
ncbi:MAG: radical SAM protein [Nanobdellota archaeon]